MQKISFRNVWFDDPLSEAKIENASFDVALDSHRAILCNNRAVRLALVDLISGISQPDSGEMSVPDSISFPVGSRDLIPMRFSVNNNIKFLSRLYGIHAADLQDFLDVMIGAQYSRKIPLNKLPVELKASIPFVLSYGVPFDNYLASNTALPPAGAPGFKNLLRYLGQLALQRRFLLLVTGAHPRAKGICDAGSILNGGEMVHYDDINAAIGEFKNMARSTALAD